MPQVDRVNAFRFYGRFFAIKIDKGKFTKDLEERADALVRNAARVFIRTLITRIPIWTGFTMGSIKFAQGNNGDLHAFLGIAVPIGGTHRTPRYYYPPNRVRRIRKIPENAGKYANYSFTNSRHIYQFSFRDDVVQFLINEFYSNVSPTSPWNSLKVARDAFEDYLVQHVRGLPKVIDYQKFVDVKINPKGG